MPSKSSSSASSSAAAAPAKGPRIQTRRSGVHGKGVFALRDIAPGETLIEYKGEVISWKEALRRHPHDPAQPQHTFYFHIDDGHVIDGRVQGNAAKWINHSCEPNCEADEDGGRVHIKALRAIHAGEELNYDYGLVIDEPYTPELLAEFPCWCGSEQCRGTLLTPKEEDEDKKARKQEKKAQKKAKKAKKAEKAEKIDKVEKKARTKAEHKVLKADKARKAAKD